MISRMKRVVVVFFSLWLVIGCASTQEIDDHALEHKIRAVSVKFLENGKAAKVSRLIEELDRASCELELPAADPPSNGSQELYEKAKKSVLIVSGIYTCDRCGRRHERSASGFLITATGAFATNYHVVNEASNETIVATTFEGQVFPVREVLAANKRDDIAILQLDMSGADQNLSPLSISAESAAGAEVYVISHPIGRFYTLTEGIVSRQAVVRTDNGRTSRLFITADFAKGSSGAPVLNKDGQVVGIVASTESVYYTTTEDVQQNLQMVFKCCVPAKSLLKLIKSPEPEAIVAGGTFTAMGPPDSSGH